jgi:predicted RNase H-like nuclease
MCSSFLGARGVEETIGRLEVAVGDSTALVFVDAPLIVDNAGNQRPCEKQVGQRYWRWRVSANSTNRGSPRLAGLELCTQLRHRGWIYNDGRHGPPTGGRHFSECYPYTTLVGAPELGYDVDGERPRYKRQPKRMSVAQWRPLRASNCDELIRRLASLSDADPPLVLDSHPTGRSLMDESSPLADASYKHREDLIDALLCAWTAALWSRYGLARCQVLGESAEESASPAATIIAPAVRAQRRDEAAI